MRTLRTARSWDGLFSLADQAVVSCVNFSTTVFLGRWCGATELGTYALAFTVLIFVLNAQNSLISIPYTNHWRRLPAQDQRGFAGCALIQHVIFACLVAVLMLGLVAIFWLFGVSSEIRQVLLVLAVALPLLLVRDFARRFAFAHLRMAAATCLDVAVAALQVGGILLLYSTGNLSATTALTALGVGAGLGGVILLVLFRQSFALRLDLLGQAIGKHWRFGRWVLASVGVSVIQGYMVHWFLAGFVGATETGVFAACMAVVQLSNPLWLGISNLLEPRLAKTFAENGCATFRKTVARLSIAFTGLAVVFCTFLALFGERLVELLYTGGEYHGHALLIIVLALGASAAVIELGVNHGLRAMDRPDVSLRAAIVGLLMTLVTGLLLVSSHGMLGGAIALLLGTLSGGMMRAYAFAYLSRKPSGEQTKLPFPEAGAAS